MEDIFHFLDFFTKLLYGAYLTLAFSGVTLKENKKDYLTILFFVVFLQNTSYFILGEEITIYIYPFLIHFPLIYFLFKKMKRSLFHSVMSLVLAFQLLSTRAWLGIIASYCFSAPTKMLEFSTAIVSFPLGYFIGKFVAPPIARLKEEPQLMFLTSILPLCYYFITYLIEIYSFISKEDTLYFYSFLEACFVLIFIIYTLFSLKIFQEKKERDIEHAVLRKMQKQTEVELTQLHRLHEAERVYHHDMRHHGNYLLSLLPEDCDDTIREYIQSVMISSKPNQSLLCNNENLNLVLKFYRDQCLKFEIPFELEMDVCDYDGFHMIDLCSLLSNGLENAVNASKDVPISQRKISLRMKSQGQTMSIDLRNTFLQEPEFSGELPYTSVEKHGYGTKSMWNICLKYHGITRFYVTDCEFRFQTVLQRSLPIHH